MKCDIKKIDGTKRQIDIEVSGDTVKNKFNEVFNRIAKEAKVPGFRPGHAPREILEKHYAQEAHEQVIKEMVPDAYNEAIGQEKLDVVDLPAISDVKLDRTKLSFKATVEVNPEIKLKNYKGLIVNYRKVTVSPEELKKELDALKEARKIDALNDSLAKGMGFPDIQELEKAISRQIISHKEDRERQKIENEIIEQISGDLDFQLPASLVSRQLEDLVRHAKLDLAMKGLSRQKIEDEEQELKKNLQEEARRQVKVYLVLSEIAKKEGVEIGDHMPRQVMELLLREAEWKVT